MTPDTRIVVECPPVHLGRTLGAVRRGSSDPTTAVDETGWWWATRTASGPATLHVRSFDGERGLTVAVRASAWGRGAADVLERVSGLVGAHDLLESFRPDHPRVSELMRRHPGTRLPRTGALLDALVPTILGQKVVGKEAKRSYGRLVQRHGEPAPGPVDLHLPPPARALARVPLHDWHTFGVERRRAEVVRRVARDADRLAARLVDPPALRRRLLATPGIGPWTTANVETIVLGAADAVVVGDFNLPDLVAWNLAGERKADDRRMLELLAPFEGSRGRVQRLLKGFGARPPRRGPKLPFREIERA